jgi:hypothetical protein
MLKCYKLPGNVEILAELIQTGHKILQSEIHTLIDSVWNKKELPDQFKVYVYYCTSLQEGR